MRILMAILADEANVSDGGKLNVMGVFDRLMAATFPTVHPKMVYTFRLLGEYEDSGRELPIRVRLVDEDGGALFEANGQMVAPAIAPGDFLSTNQVFSLVGISFPRPGRYKFVLQVGEMATHETPLMVVQMESPQSGD